MKCALITVALLLSLATSSLAADTVTLTDGRVLEGKIVREEKGWIGLETADGVVWLEPASIASYSRAKSKAETGQANDAEQEKPPTEGGTGRDGAQPPASRDDGAQGSDPPQRPARSSATAGGTTKDDAPSDQELAAMVAALGSKDRERRIAAAGWVVETWPKWKSALGAALDADVERARIETVRLLDQEALGDTSEWVKKALDDKSPQVRMAALRVARHRKYGTIETEALNLMRNDRQWTVRQEAIRTLEDVGGAATLPFAFDAWKHEEDRDRKRRYRRVLTAILGADLGDDAEVWGKAIDDVRMGRRKIRP